MKCNQYFMVVDYVRVYMKLNIVQLMLCEIKCVCNTTLTANGEGYHMVYQVETRN